MNKKFKILFIILGAVIGLGLIYGAHHEVMQSKKEKVSLGSTNVIASVSEAIQKKT